MIIEQTRPHVLILQGQIIIPGENDLTDENAKKIMSDPLFSLYEEKGILVIKGKESAQADAPGHKSERQTKRKKEQ
jgi:hypothetical protein